MQIPQANANVNTTTSSDAAAHAPPSIAGITVPTSSTVGGGSSIDANTAAPSTSTTSTTAATNVDPFIDDDAMDIDEEILQPNFSVVRPPHPIELVQPLTDNVEFFVITVGQPIGIVTDMGNINIHAQTQFAVTRFPTWYGAVGFYTIHFYSGHVRLVPVNTTPPQRGLFLRRLAPPESDVPPRPAAGSAANPIYVGTPIAAAGPAPLAATPTPMNQGSRWKGKGRATFRTPVKYQPFPLKHTALRIIKAPPPTRIVYVSDSDSDDESTTPKVPSNEVSIIDSAIDAAVAPPIDPTVASVDGVDGNVEVEGAEHRGAVVHGSDDEGPDFLPNYPRGPTSTSAAEQSAPGTPSGAPRASPSRASPSATEIPATPVRHSPSARVFVSLFSDGSGTGPRLDLAHVLRSGKRFRLTPRGRRLMEGGADPLSPLTPLTPSTVPSVNASPIAGPSRQAVVSTPVVAPLAGPSHQAVSLSPSPRNDDVNNNVDDAASVSSESEYRVSEIDPADMEAVGQAIDEAYIKWMESESK